MHILLYVIAFFSAVIGLILGNLNDSISSISTGMLSGVLFGAFGRVVHLLDQVEDHLRHLRRNGAKIEK